MRDKALHSSQTRSESMCFPHLRACLISERKGAKEPPRIRENQTRKRWVEGKKEEKKRKKKEKKRKYLGLPMFQNCCKLETGHRRWTGICVWGGSNGHSNPSDRKYCFKAASYPSLSLASRTEGSTQPTLQQKGLHYGGSLTGTGYLGRLWSPHHCKFWRKG